MSLRLRLLLIIGASLTVLWTVVAAWMFMGARQSLRDVLDNRLAASARMVAGLVAQFPEPRDLAVASHKPLDVIARDGVACEVSLVRSEVMVQPVARTAGSPDLTRLDIGFSTHQYGNKRWRTYVLRQGDVQIATADSIEVRESLLRELIVSAGLPFLVALVVSLALLWLGITHGLAPLEKIRGLLAQRRPGDDSPLPPIRTPFELRPLLHTIERLLERLQAAIVRERRFTDSAAHELRTPLTGIKTHIQVAKLASKRPSEAHTLDIALDKAALGVQQLQNILLRLLELARLEGQPAADDISEPLTAILAAIEAIGATHHDAADRIRIDAHPTTNQLVPVVQPLLIAAVQNLLDNALRYAPAHTPITVRVHSPNPESVHISVMDEGDGLSEEGRQQAADRFWRANSSTPGYGLGLSIVSAIMHRHGGTLELLNRPEGGLEARLLFPLARDGDARPGGVTDPATDSQIS